MCSIHNFNDGSYFPGSQNGSFIKIGNGKGEGYNLNIPWNVFNMKEHTVGDDEYIYVVDNLLMPIFK